MAVAASVATILAPGGTAAAAPHCAGPNPPPICFPAEPPPKPQHAVVGHLDAVTPVDGGLRVAGWALDPDTTAPIRVRLSVGGSLVTETLAAVERPDVAAAHPGKGSAHGFDVVLPRPANGRRAVCATGVNVGAGPAAVEVGCLPWTELRNPPEAAEQLTLLTANLQGRESGVVDWRVRHQRLAAWITTNRIVPDLLVLQEVPASKCWFAGGCSPRDYEALFAVIHSIRDGVGVTYRIAHLSVGSSVEGWNPLYQGRAVLYNPARVRNTLVGPHVQAPYNTTLDENPRAQQSHPCLSPPPAWAPDCGLLDRATGVHHAVRGISFGRFELVERPGLSIDVYDMHAWNLDDPGISYATLVQRLVPAVPPAGTRLYPPIVAGDFNAGIADMRNEVAPGGRLEPFEIGAYVEPPDVMGLLLGERGAFPAVRAATVAESRVLPDAAPAGNAPCGPEEPRWSDHCAVFVRLDPS